MKIAAKLCFELQESIGMLCADTRHWNKRLVKNARDKSLHHVE